MCECEFLAPKAARGKRAVEWNVFPVLFFFYSVSGGATGRNDSCAFRLPEADPNKKVFYAMLFCQRQTPKEVFSHSDLILSETD